MLYGLASSLVALIGPSTERFLNQHLKLHQKETIKTIHQQKSTYSHCDLSLCLKSVKVIQDRDRKQEDKLIQSTKRQLKRVLMFQLTVPFFCIRTIIIYMKQRVLQLRFLFSLYSAEWIITLHIL